MSSHDNIVKMLISNKRAYNSKLKSDKETYSQSNKSSSNTKNKIEGSNILMVGWADSAKEGRQIWSRQWGSKRKASIKTKQNQKIKTSSGENYSASGLNKLNANIRTRATKGTKNTNITFSKLTTIRLTITM